MAIFTTRVELHQGESSDYAELHKEMTKNGFTRFIIVNKEKRLMPTAEYTYTGEVVKAEVLKLAKEAVAVIRKEAAILITESAGRTSHNLPKPN